MFKISKISKIILLPLVLASCIINDGPYKNCKEYHFSETFKEYILFPENSYWIYKEVSTNERDSVFLKEQSVIFNKICDYRGKPQDVLIQMFYSSFYSIDTLCIAVSCYASHKSSYNTSGYNSFGSYIDTDIEGEGTHIRFEKYHDFFSIDGTEFSQVKVLITQEFSNNGIKLSRYYWANRVGLIRKELSNGQIWNLTKYHIDK